MEEVWEWQNRPLERLHRVVFFDAFQIKIRDEGTVKIKLSIWRWEYHPTGPKIY